MAPAGMRPGPRVGRSPSGRALPTARCTQVAPQAARALGRRAHDRRSGSRTARPPTMALATEAHFEVQLLHPTTAPVEDEKPCLVYIPGSDGTGNSIVPQLPGLIAAGFDVRCIYIPMTDRSSWEDLTVAIVPLLREVVAAKTQHRTVTLVGESFGGCLALRIAEAAPELLASLVLVNPATSFRRAFGGLPALIAGTNLLSLFPGPLYQVAQAVLVPFLVDKDNVGSSGLVSIKKMMLMQPAPDFQYVEGRMRSGAGGPATRELAQPRGLEPYLPSATASWRIRLLRDGDLPASRLAAIRAPTLVVVSAADRLLPSLAEGARLVRLMPDARRLVLPESGHTALLESAVCLSALLRRAGFLPPALRGPRPPRAAEAGALASEPCSSQAVAAFDAARGAAAGAHVSASTHNGNGAAAQPLAGPLEPAQAAALRSRLGSAEADLDSGGPESARSPAVALAMNGHPVPVTTGPAQHNGAGLEAWMSSAVSELADTPDARVAAEVLRAADKAPAAPGPAVRHGNGAQAQQAPQQAQHPSTARAREEAAAMADVWGGIDEDFEEGVRLLGPLRALLSPVVRGVECLPDPLRGPRRPLLFVGNHTLFGMLDLPFLMLELYLRGHKVRGLAHPAHWQGPQGALFDRFGAVKASPRTAYRLLRNKESVLLFPGGGREVTKRKGEEYRLFWRDSPDFVRMAAKLKAVIVPFAAVGGDDAFDVALDTDDILANPILGPLARGALARVAGPDVLDPSEAVFPLTRLPGTPLPSLLPVPRPNRLYFRFMPPMDAAAVIGDVNDMERTAAAYNEVQDAVKAGLAALLAECEHDPERTLPARLAAQARRLLPTFDLMSAAVR